MTWTPVIDASDHVIARRHAVDGNVTRIVSVLAQRQTLARARVGVASRRRIVVDVDRDRRRRFQRRWFLLSVPRRRVGGARGSKSHAQRRDAVRGRIRGIARRRDALLRLNAGGWEKNFNGRPGGLSSERGRRTRRCGARKCAEERTSERCARAVLAWEFIHQRIVADDARWEICVGRRTRVSLREFRRFGRGAPGVVSYSVVLWVAGAKVPR